VIWNLRNGTELVDARYLTYGSGIGDARAGQIVRYDATWRVAANVDMNGDRVRDFVYTRDGEIRVLTVGQLNGQTATVEADREYTFSAKFGSLSGQAARPFPGWELVGVEDMSGDGQRDFVFYSRQFDRTVIWFTDTAGTITEGAVVTSAARPGGQETGAPFAWNVQALGDFTGDGKIDMLWRNDQDVVVLWELDGTVLRTGPGAKSQLLPSIGGSFKVRGVGDFNGDGVQDIVWRDQTGNVNRIWTFGTDGQRTEMSLLSATNSQWEISGVGDLNGDGTTDIVWRNNQENNVVVWNIQNAALLVPGSGYVLNFLPGGDRQVINPGRSFRIESVTGLDPVV
jgi:FG-GAP-like repeat/FG-GAP repeat